MVIIHFPLLGCLKTEEADIYFLIDESGSITENEFQMMKKFILELMFMFHIGPKQVRVGLVKFSSKPKLEFNLLETKDRASLDAAVQKVYLDGGGTKIGLALDRMQSLFQEAVASRPNPDIPRILIVITDGVSEDNPKPPAQELREQGIIIYTIGVKDANKQQLELISGDPKNTFTVNNFDALFSIKDVIVQKMCSKEGENLCVLCNIFNIFPLTWCLVCLVYVLYKLIYVCAYVFQELFCSVVQLFPSQHARI